MGIQKAQYRVVVSDHSQIVCPRKVKDIVPQKAKTCFVQSCELASPCFQPIEEKEELVSECVSECSLKQLPYRYASRRLTLRDLFRQ